RLRHGARLRRGIFPNSDSLRRRTLMLRQLSTLLILATVALAGACHSRRAKYVPQEVTEVLGVQAADIQHAVATLVDSGAPPSWVTAQRWKQVRALYSVYDDAPLWLEPDGVKDRAGALLAALDSAPQHG